MSEEEWKKKKAEGLVEQIIVENLPKPKKETGIQVQEAQRTLPQINRNKLTPRHTGVKIQSEISKIKRTS